jgi:hypothetical protein
MRAHDPLTTADTTLRTEADAFVASLLERYTAQYPWQPPVNLERLAALAQTKIFIGAPLRGVKGRLVPEADGFAIWLSRDAQDGRSFTIAHELGHQLFYEAGRDGRPRRRADLTVRPAVEERVCDYIAANLLMPRDLVDAALGSNVRMGVDTVLGVHRKFAVSVRAAARRVLNDLHPESGALFTRWRRHQQSELGDVLALDWAEGRIAAPSPGAIAPAASPLYSALFAGAITEGIEPSLTTRGSMWWTEALAWTGSRDAVFAMHRELTPKAG